MSNEILKKIHQKYTAKKVPNIKPGHTIEVETIIRDGDKQRIQKFRGLVLSVNGSGTAKMITVRKISYGVGVEKKFPIYATNIGKITLLKEEKVKRAKLYFMRDRIGKSALRVRKGRAMVIPQEGKVEDESVMEVVIPEETTPASE